MTITIYYETITELLEASRFLTANLVNAVVLITGWALGRHSVERKQGGEERAAYGTALLKKLSRNLTSRFGRGFSKQSLQRMRPFYLLIPPEKICSTVSSKFDNSNETRTLSTPERLTELAQAFPLSWSHYVELLPIADENERSFYEDKESLTDLEDRLTDAEH